MRRKKHWNELTTGQKASVFLSSAVQLSLLLAALADLRKRPAAQINGPKPAWAVGSFISFFGPIAYFLFGRKKVGQPSAFGQSR
ncbi:PLD nuclease N-terminal domain-containing protein [Crystallibacter crystallopoietes]|nr:PLD nuclease N-terminal domain-containing protein [Arthrobacter crystallopoietes]